MFDLITSSYFFVKYSGTQGKEVIDKAESISSQDLLMIFQEVVEEIVFKCAPKCLGSFCCDRALESELLWRMKWLEE